MYAVCDTMKVFVCPITHAARKVGYRVRASDGLDGVYESIGADSDEGGGDEEGFGAEHGAGGVGF